MLLVQYHFSKNYISYAPSPIPSSKKNCTIEPKLAVPQIAKIYSSHSFVKEKRPPMDSLRRQQYAIWVWIIVGTMSTLRQPSANYLLAPRLVVVVRAERDRCTEYLHPRNGTMILSNITSTCDTTMVTRLCSVTWLIASKKRSWYWSDFICLPVCLLNVIAKKEPEHRDLSGDSPANHICKHKYVCTNVLRKQQNLYLNILMGKIWQKTILDVEPESAERSRNGWGRRTKKTFLLHQSAQRWLMKLLIRHLPSDLKFAFWVSSQESLHEIIRDLTTPRRRLARTR